MECEQINKHLMSAKLNQRKCICFVDVMWRTVTVLKPEDKTDNLTFQPWRLLGGHSSINHNFTLEVTSCLSCCLTDSGACQVIARSSVSVVCSETLSSFTVNTKYIQCIFLQKRESASAIAIGLCCACPGNILRINNWTCALIDWVWDKELSLFLNAPWQTQEEL